MGIGSGHALSAWVHAEGAGSKGGRESGEKSRSFAHSTWEILEVFEPVDRICPVLRMFGSNMHCC